MLQLTSKLSCRAVQYTDLAESLKRTLSVLWGIFRSAVAWCKRTLIGYRYVMKSLIPFRSLDEAPALPWLVHHAASSKVAVSVHRNTKIQGWDPPARQPGLAQPMPEREPGTEI